MTENPRVRNVAVVIILVAVFVVPAFFLEPQRAIDLWSAFMILFALAGLRVISGETWNSFWDGSRDRAALALYGLFALFVSIIFMRSYGITIRNFASADEYLEHTYVYSSLVYLQFIGLWLFSRASTAPTVPVKGGGMGQLIAGIVIGVVVASSKLLEPLLAMVGKVIGRVF